MTAPSAPVTFRRARHGDLAAIIALLGDDPLGATREDLSDPPNAAYEAAFAAIKPDLESVEIPGSVINRLRALDFAFLSAIRLTAINFSESLQ